MNRTHRDDLRAMSDGGLARFLALVAVNVKAGSYKEFQPTSWEHWKHWLRQEAKGVKCNGDNVRSMNNEQLADFIYETIKEFSATQICAEATDALRENILKWIQQEAE